MSKPRFQPGDYVEARAVCAPAYDEDGSKRTLERREETVRGWIVGAVWRYEGMREGGVSYPDDEGYERPYLAVTGSRLLWKIARSLTNLPVEALEADVDLLAQAGSKVSPALGERVPSCPLRRTSPWAVTEGGWTAAKQREEMRAWPRDANGHWLPKPNAKTAAR
jgi:hypothetical protein